MSSDLFNQIIACGVSKKDARDAIELAKVLQKVDECVALSPCVINFIKSSPLKTNLSFNFDDQAYSIFISNLSKRVDRIEFSFVPARPKSKLMTRKEKFLSLSVNQIRRRIQNRNLKLFTPEHKFKKAELSRILEIISTLKGYIFSDNLLIFEKEEFDAQFITAVCLYYYKRGASFSYLSDILFWEPK